MAPEYNLIRGLTVVVGALKVCSQDICNECVCMEFARDTLNEKLSKLRKDIENSPDKEKKEMLIKIDKLSEEIKGLLKAKKGVCQKTAGLCKIPGCLTNSVLDMLKQVH